MAGTPRVGDPAPDFELEGTEGPFRLSDHAGHRVVLLFYPGDFTPVCTRQFRSYADRAGEVGDLDAIVVGISSQGLGSHQSFCAANDIPVPLLADTGGAVARAYGVTAPVLGTRRAVVIVDADRTITHRDVHTVGLTYRSVDDLRNVLERLGTRSAR